MVNVMSSLILLKKGRLLNIEYNHNWLFNERKIEVDFQHTLFIKVNSRASLVAQWLRGCLLMQGTRVRALVWEDPTCRGATGPVNHNY